MVYLGTLPKQLIFLVALWAYSPHVHCLCCSTSKSGQILNSYQGDEIRRHYEYWCVTHLGPLVLLFFICSSEFWIEVHCACWLHLYNNIKVLDYRSIFQLVKYVFPED